MANDNLNRRHILGGKSFLALVVAGTFGLGLISCGAQSRDTRTGTTRAAPSAIVLDAMARKQVITEAAATIRDNYADREVGETLAATLMKNLDDGRYDAISDADSLVAAVMTVIRSKVADRHFDFSVLRQADTSKPGSNSSPVSRHGLRTVRILDHGTSYLEFDALPGDSAAMRFVADALAALPEVRAIVFDLRRNIGGSGDMVILLCSHLLEPQSLLYKVYGRSGGPPGEAKTTATRRQFGPAIPVYVLTSGATVSAAEAFAYILQDYRRAILVGERTAGMANPSRTFSIGERFDLTVPFLLFRYGRSGGTFAGVGVIPDISVPADSALDTALAEIGKKSVSAQ